MSEPAARWDFDTCECRCPVAMHTNSAGACQTRGCDCNGFRPRIMDKWAAPERES